MGKPAGCACVSPIVVSTQTASCLETPEKVAVVEPTEPLVRREKDTLKSCL